MKLIGAVMAVAALGGCDGETMVDVDAPPLSVDAQVDAAIDAMVEIDAEQPPAPECTPGAAAEPPAPSNLPVGGTYCATWTRVDGVHDAFARYYDRVDIELDASPTARWWTSGSGGAKEYIAGAGPSDCLVVAPFVGDGALSGSGDVKICWESETVAHGTMAWCITGVSDTHWSVRLDACP
jgi:hypothetical protein